MPFVNEQGYLVRKRTTKQNWFFVRHHSVKTKNGLVPMSLFLRSGLIFLSAAWAIETYIRSKMLPWKKIKEFLRKEKEKEDGYR